jgi:GNAT superfamily N-acetyltransferase
MPDAIIDRLSPTDLNTITFLYNAVFRPTRDEAWFRRRLEGRPGALVQVARVENDAVGFYVGYELKPETHYAWLVGVAPEVRRSGIATQLMHAAEDVVRTEGNRLLRFECDNHIRSFLHFGIANGYDITGLRWDSDRMSNLIVFEKHLETVPR